MCLYQYAIFNVELTNFVKYISLFLLTPYIQQLPNLDRGQVLKEAIALRQAMPG